VCKDESHSATIAYTSYNSKGPTPQGDITWARWYCGVDFGFDFGRFSNATESSRPHTLFWSVMHLSVFIHDQGRTGSSNRPWLSRQTGPISSDVTRNSGPPAQIFKYVIPSICYKSPRPPPHSSPSFPVLLSVTLSLAPSSLLHRFPVPVNGVSLLTYFIIWRGGPPGRRTNRPTWQVSGCQAAQSADVQSIISRNCVDWYTHVQTVCGYWLSIGLYEGVGSYIDREIGDPPPSDSHQQRPYSVGPNAGASIISRLILARRGVVAYSIWENVSVGNRLGNSRSGISKTGFHLVRPYNRLWRVAERPSRGSTDVTISSLMSVSRTDGIGCGCGR